MEKMKLEKLDIHNYTMRLKRELGHLEKSIVTENNKALIMKFHDDCFLEKLSKPRICRLLQNMRYIAVMLKKDFATASIDDLKKLIRHIDEQEWSPWTKIGYAVALKKFYKWFKGNKEDSREYPVEVKWIKTTVNHKEIEMLSEKELFTEQEIQKVIDVSDHPRNKAFLAILAESGARIGEIGSLLIKNIAFDEQGVILTVNGKTGARRIRVISSTPYLASWLNCHALKDNPEAPLWICVGATNYHKAMSYNGFTKVLRDTCRRAGIKKRCNPHIFRHSRASKMANHLTEFQMNHHFGWTQGSDMPSTYVHLSGKDLDKAILNMNGLTETEQKKDNTPQIAKCPRCRAINSKESKYCSTCAAILDEGTAIQAQQVVNPQNSMKDLLGQIMQDQDMQDVLKQKMLAIILEQKVITT